MISLVKIHVDPDSYIPFANIWEVLPSGVTILMAYLDGLIGDNQTGISGIDLGSDLPLVGELSGKLLQYVQLFFRKKDCQRKGEPLGGINENIGMK